ncbi:MAG TPA: DUF3592 domain-containing protein, partial [Luteolibacter sp.]|nr:DUF3592 domain-containing protein [Luteolibacter sp.]
ERRHDNFSPIEYRHELSFGYEWEQKPYTGTSLSLRGAKWSSQEGRAAEIQARYPVGMRTECRVNPADPRVAVIEPESLAPAYSIWFPALFVVGGLGIVGRALRGARKGR